MFYLDETSKGYFKLGFKNSTDLDLDYSQIGDMGILGYNTRLLHVFLLEIKNFNNRKRYSEETIKELNFVLDQILEWNESVEGRLYESILGPYNQKLNLDFEDLNLMGQFSKFRSSVETFINSEELEIEISANVKTSKNVTFYINLKPKGMYAPLNIEKSWVEVEENEIDMLEDLFDKFLKVHLEPLNRLGLYPNRSAEFKCKMIGSSFKENQKDEYLDLIRQMIKN